MNASVSRPRIGITCRLVKFPESDPALMGVRETYHQSILAAGGLPYFIPLSEDESIVRAHYDSVDGLLLPGGEDVDPKFYAEAPHPKLGTTSPLRDKVELAVSNWAYADSKPLLAICRGMQVVNVALGGSLYQDIPSQLTPKFNHAAHGSETDWTQAAHKTILEPDSRLAKIVGSTELPVNSLHHQSLKKLGAGLKQVGRSEDGIVEAIEAPNKPFFFGLQCHPESLWQDTDPRWLELFKQLVDASRTFGQSRS